MNTICVNCGAEEMLTTVEALEWMKHHGPKKCKRDEINGVPVSFSKHQQSERCQSVFGQAVGAGHVCQCTRAKHTEGTHGCGCMNQWTDAEGHDR